MDAEMKEADGEGSGQGARASAAKVVAGTRVDGLVCEVRSIQLRKFASLCILLQSPIPLGALLVATVITLRIPQYSSLCTYSDSHELMS